ncbi:hypothetical protein SN13_23165 [Vibrio alginolyticus]|nr:hypothetical protein SN12_23270 [Vibrio alginolyticus]KIP79624.1 hypothetical protein SN13_23165 [Vibrio alginolyticus]
MRCSHLNRALGQSTKFEGSILNTIEKKKNERFKVMEKIYSITDGVEREQLQILNLAEALGLSDSDESLNSLVNILNYLANESLIKVHRIHGGLPAAMQITHKGVLEVEQALFNPQKETEHFVQNITITNNIDSMVNSNIQQATTNSHQTQIYLNESDKSVFADHLSELKREIDTLKSELTPIQYQDLVAETSTIDGQLQSSKPKKAIIHSSLETVTEILKGAAGSGTWELISAMTAALATMA